MRNIKEILNKEIAVKDILFCFLILSAVFIVSASYIYGIETTSNMTQSFGIGLGSLFAGLAGLTAFLDWLDKAKKAEKYIKELKEKYPRKLLHDGILKIGYVEGNNKVYLLDTRNDKLIKRWFQNREAMKDLGYTTADGTGVMPIEDLNKYIEEDPIVAKRDFY